MLAAAALGSALLGTAGIAAAAQSESSDPPAATAAAQETPADAPARPPRPPRGDRTPLSDETAAKVEAAALAAVPGATVEHAKSGRGDAAYVAHLVKADGTHVRVKLDDAFNVTSVEEGGPKGRCDHDGGPRPGGPPAAAQA